MQRLAGRFRSLLRRFTSAINISVQLYPPCYSRILIIKYISNNSYIDQSSYDKLYDLVANSTVYNTLPPNRLDRFIYNLEHQDERYTSEIQILINILLEKRGIRRRDILYLYIINKWYFSANFDFIENYVFNWSISVYYTKINKIQEIRDLANKIEK